ncbi:MAG: hypothetical protein IPH12_00370 [Saprospirales bacterium]|nr:hypothetical protein [Saprospirales bacterium]
MKLFLHISLFLLFSGALPGQCLQLQGCPAGLEESCDLTINDANLWNEAYWWAALYQTHDLPEHETSLCFSAADTCAGASLDIGFLLFLDLDGDGQQETVVNSATPPPATTVYFGNAANPGYSGGTPRAFDERPVPAGQLYGFAIEQTGPANNRTACVRWHTADAPGTYVTPQLPYGTHRIRWIVSNGLGQTDSCEYAINIRDCKKPTVVCLNGLSANIMPTGQITIWASDVLQYAEDNVSLVNLLQVAMRRTGAGTGFPLDSAGNPLTSVTYTCDDLGLQTVELWARDADGNADYCETVIDLQDNFLVCSAGPVAVDVRLCVELWCTGEVVTGVEFGPQQALFHIEADGCLAADTTIGLNFLDLTPMKVSDPLNGVNLLDLIKLNDHILGLEPLSSPYVILAADVNRSSSVTTFDIVEIRKLLAGIYLNFPNNNSWRFVDADFVFPNPSNPFQTVFPTAKQLTAVNDTIQGDVRFRAIKVGDTDCSALPGFAPPGEDRAVARLNLPDLALQAGETVDVPLCFETAEDWRGFQLALAFDPAQLALERVTSGNLPGWDTLSAVQTQAGRLHVTWFDAQPHRIGPGAPVFSLRLRALAPVLLRETLRLAPGRLPAQAYTAQKETRGLELQFTRPEEAAAHIGAPQPNPTAAGATLAVRLAEPAPVQAEVWDAGGRCLWRRESRPDAGVQQIELPAQAFPASGVYWWRVTAGADSRSGRLVVLR